jgi:hypothetical protein
VLSPEATCRLQGLPRQLYDRTACTVSMPRGTVRTVQSSPFFACLPFRTERDILRIRSPFDEVNIWRNQEDETDAMALVSSDSEHFHF